MRFLTFATEPHEGGGSETPKINEKPSCIISKVFQSLFDDLHSKGLLSLASLVKEASLFV